MKINEVIKTGIVKYNGKTFDVYQVVKVNEETKELFTQSSVKERGAKERKFPKKFIESLETIAAKAMASLELFANVKETNPPIETINLMTANLNESLHSMCLDYIAEIDSYNGKQEKLANPFKYVVTAEELEVFTEV